MAGMSSLFSSYNPCFGSDKIRITNGSLSPVFGKDSISVTPYTTLSYILHIPNFATNFLFIAHNTCELNCGVIFYSYYCFFLGTSHCEDN